MRNSYWMVTVVPEARFGHDKFSLQAGLRARGVDSRPFFSQLSGLKAYAGRSDSARFLPSAPAGAAAATRGVNLPSGYGLDEATVDRVCAALLDTLATPA